MEVCLAFALNSVLSVGRDSLVGIGNLLGGEIFRTCPDQPWGPASFLCHEYRVIPGGKAAGPHR
jgi:hypothetical protein